MDRRERTEPVTVRLRQRVEAGFLTADAGDVVTVPRWQAAAVAEALGDDALEVVEGTLVTGKAKRSGRGKQEAPAAGARDRAMRRGKAVEK